jgi:hypothetical protein
MKVQMTVDVSDEAAIAIGLIRNETLTRATRAQVREHLLTEVLATLHVLEDNIKRITAEVLQSAGLELAPLGADPGPTTGRVTPKAV